MSDYKALHQAQQQLKRRPRAAALVMLGGFFLLIVLLISSISLGVANITLQGVWDAIFHFQPENNHHQIIRELRIPRVLAGALIGASFAVAGALMQGMSRNPLADSGILGINAGAAFMLTLCFAFFPATSSFLIMLFSFAGAAISVAIVYGIGNVSLGGLTPARMVLAGTTISALFGALGEGVSLYFQIGQNISYWYAGGLANTSWEKLVHMAPWMIGALLASIVLSRSITILSMGEDVAAGLGVNTQRIKLVAMLLVLILAGASVSIVGAIGFIGLIIPHVTRALVGVDYRLIIPCSAILGGVLVVGSDLAARLIHPPYETPIGAITALLGVPFFLYLARKERRGL
ncbi:FecCD family ABC transporter permease [Paenibacillus septentrionalis]|uniref:FecCD family ABC transporter permease n=1 Tax=Paenibacillus septentrionalis TaxID=429342 RepID=A0ABW1V5A9_9BACL